MNRFYRKTSKYSIVFVWVFIAAFLMDGANITDIYSDCETIHFEESANTADVYVAVNTSTPHAIKPSAGKGYSHSGPLVLKHIVFDQDSPSLAARPICAEETSIFFSSSEQVLHREVHPASSLYLRNCTLLI